MKVNPLIFKSYDIRGIYPKELNKETAFKIGQAFVNYTKAKDIIVGRDMRLSSPVLFESLSRGIISQGANVYDIGQVPTECVYFSTGYYKYKTGIMITASHNPREYNGFKMINKVKVVSGKALLNIIEKDFSSKKEGKIKELDIWSDYINHIFSFVNLNKIKPFKIVIDAGNGMAGKVIPLIEKRLPVKISPLSFKLDGSFPVHSPNPLSQGATDQISREVKKQKADLGFIFDPDADRIYLIDELGNFVRADVTLLILAKHLLEKNPNKGIAYNLICSKAVPEFIKKWGGRPLRTPVGFINIQKAIEENDGIMGGELSGHYCFRDNYYLDSGFISLLLLLEVISDLNKKVSKIKKELSPYAKGSEINFKVRDKEKILDLVKKEYSDGKQDYLDGVTVEYNDWWFNLRPSNTEPLLRLTIEADSQKLLKQKTKELSSLVLNN